MRTEKKQLNVNIDKNLLGLIKYNALLSCKGLGTVVNEALILWLENEKQKLQNKRDNA